MQTLTIGLMKDTIKNMQKHFRINLLFLLVAYLLCGNTVAQSIVKREIYTVNFSNSLHEPFWVSYKLYRGGGECSRTKFRFHNDIDRSEEHTSELQSRQYLVCR